MDRSVVCVVCAFLALSASQPADDKRYRTDYEYNRKSHAFYKFHATPARWWRASEVCRVEGAQLMVPQSSIDVVQAHLMFKRYPDLEYAWVSYDGHAHESAEEDPIIDLTPQRSDYANAPMRSMCDVIAHTGEVQSHTCLTTLPFICKVPAQDAYFDTQCQVYGKNYRFVSSTSSCYKIPPKAYTWNEAYTECEAEGAHLVIINSVTEHSAVQHILETNPAVEDSKASWFFFAGFRADRTTNDTSRVFRTVLNQTLEEAGFNQWSENEPNNAKSEEYCGSIFKNDGKYNDLNCMDHFGFVCEKEVFPNAS